MSKKHSLVGGTLLLTCANIGLRGSGMCFQVFLSNQIGATGIGLLQLILSVSFFATTIGNGGVRVAAMYLTAEEQGAGRLGGVKLALHHCLALGFLVSVVTGVALFFSADWIGAHWIGDVQAVASLRILGVFLPSTCLWSVMAAYYTATSRLTTLVWVEFVDQAIHIGLTITLLALWARGDIQRSCSSIVLGSGVSTLITLLVLVWLAREKGTEGATGRGMWRRLFRISLPLAVNDALRSGLSTVEHMLIPKGLARSGASSVGAMASYGMIMGMVFPVMMFPAVILMSLGDLLVPELAKWKSRKNSQRIQSLCDRCLRMGTVFALAVGGICWSTSHFLGNALYGDPQVGTYLRIFAPLILVLYLDSIVDGIHKGLGEQVYCVRVNTFTNLLDVILLWFLLPKLGISGFILTFTVTHLINFYLSMARLVKVTGYRLPVGFFVKAQSCALVAAVFATWSTVGQLSDGMTILIGGCSFLAIFSSLLLLSATFSGRDLRWIGQMIKPKKVAWAEREVNSKLHKNKG